MTVRLCRSTDSRRVTWFCESSPRHFHCRLDLDYSTHSNYDYELAVVKVVTVCSHDRWYSTTYETLPLLIACERCNTLDTPRPFLLHYFTPLRRFRDEFHSGRVSCVVLCHPEIRTEPSWKN
ncbi:hypothetical protein EVAR_102884_1 [Eumeta japonica]|uniref:Uncharacterized protein n=1 Tax=Eumeta variegata TaxID=151549 RepID=A0A4C1UMS8_EUMVA|nr:hypothetical protein EVAR_102884_1 [Eumeta japonica]